LAIDDDSYRLPVGFDVEIFKPASRSACAPTRLRISALRAARGERPRFGRV